MNLFIIVNMEKFSSPFCDDCRPIILLFLILLFILIILFFLIFVIRVFIIRVLIIRIISFIFLIFFFKPGKSGRLFIVTILLEQRRSGILNNIIQLEHILVVTVVIVAIAAVTATAIQLLVHFSSNLLELLEHILLYISSVILEGSVHLSLD